MPEPHGEVEGILPQDEKPQTNQFEDNANALVHNLKYLFVQIPEQEFKTKKVRPGEKSFYIETVNASEQLVLSIEEDILTGQSANDRAVLIEKWIKRMDTYWEEGNHLAVLAINNALNKTSIARLKLSNDLLSEQAVNRLKHYRELFGSSGKNYRPALTEALKKDKNIVPAIAAYAGDVRNSFDQVSRIKLITETEGKEIDEKTLNEAKNSNTPLLIKKPDNRYMIYGNKKEDDNWLFTEINPQGMHLDAFPFDQGMIKTDDPLLKTPGLVSALREGHGAIRYMDTSKQLPVLQSLQEMQAAVQNTLTGEILPLSLQLEDATANQIDRYNRAAKLEPRLGEVLLADIEKGSDAKKNAIDSLFEMVAQMETKAKYEFYSALKVQFPHIKMLDAVIPAYAELLLAQESKDETHIENAKKDVKKLDIMALQQMVRNDESPAPEKIWTNIIKKIPKDPLNDTNIFNLPISLVDNNHPRHEDIRHSMSRDMRNYRYVAPKGEGGAQESGPLGGWYIGCYKTPDGKIHTQRFMVKRESQFRKNIIESLCGRLKTNLVNWNEDYAAGTYLVRDPTKKATGENTYAVSIAFDEFKETHKLVGLEHRVRMAGSRNKIYGGDAADVFNKIKKLHDDEEYTGLEESLIASWWTGDSDVHSGNIGANTRLKRFLNIDHAGGMLELDPKIHPNRHGLWENMKRVMRPIRYFYDAEKRSAEPTYHAHEYPSGLRTSKKMAKAIKDCTSQMTAADIKKTIDEEINEAVKNYRDDPDEIKRFAKRVGVPKELLTDDIEHNANEAKKFLYEIMYARLVNLRQYGNEIELSLCFEYSEKTKEFVIKDHERLENFIRENPNYCQSEKHHLRGNNKSQSFLYHVFHNKYGTGKKIEDLLKNKTQEVLDKKEFLSIHSLMLKDFDKEKIPDRAQNYITRLRVIQSILQDNNLLEGNPHKDKLNELIEFLEMYSKDPSKVDFRRQHLLQVCDRAYATIDNIYADLNQYKNNNSELAAKIKIYEIFNELNKDEKLMAKFNAIPTKDNEAFNVLLHKKLNNVTIDNAAFTQIVKNSAQHIESLATNIHFNTQRRKGVSSIEEKRKTIEELTNQLTTLSRNEDGAINTLAQVKESISRAEKELQPKSADEIRSKQEYLTTVHELQKTAGKSFLDQSADIYHQNASNLSDHLQMSTIQQKSTLASIPTDNTAILVDYPNTQISGMLVIDGGSTIVDCGNIKDPLSYANILAHLLLSHTHGTSLEALREHIQKNYITVIQNRYPPEFITPQNLKNDLLDPLLKNPHFKNEFHFEVSRNASMGLFRKMLPLNLTQGLTNRVHAKFQEKTVWNPELIERAKMWVDTHIKNCHRDGTDFRRVILENPQGNDEMLRHILILLSLKGVDPKQVNATGYPFIITPEDKVKMQAYLDNPSSHKTVDFRQTEKALHLETTLLDGPHASRELTAVLRHVTGQLGQNFDDYDPNKLTMTKTRFLEDAKLIKQLDPNGIYGKDIQDKITQEIDRIDSKLASRRPMRSI